MSNKVVLHLTTKNDPNGNPRRLYLIVDPRQSYRAITHVIEEGYRGWSGLKGFAGPDDCIIPISVPYSEYKSWIDYGKDDGIYIP